MWIRSFLTSALDGGEWLSSCHGKEPDTHDVQGEEGPRADLDTWRRENVFPLPEFEHGTVGIVCSFLYLIPTCFEDRLPAQWTAWHHPHSGS
jgi:hypothetical protein